MARALELDDALAEAHFALAAQFASIDWNWAGADLEFQRAIDINPNYGQARAFYSHYLHFMKRSDEAMTQIERAMELDPVTPISRTSVATRTTIRCAATRASRIWCSEWAADFAF